MDIHAKAFWLPKRGSSEAEYEDASSISEDKSRFAVADGATEASFSGVWAKQLVRAFTSCKLTVPIAVEHLKPLQSKWEKIIRRHPLSWYAEEKANSGAFAAFVGVELLEEQSDTGAKRTWKGTAAGDSCLVQMRGEQIIHAFPLADSISFNNHPNLISSTPASNGNGIEFVVNSTGSWGCEDVFFLMTDALACWFFNEREQGNRPWHVLRDLDTQGQVSFEQFIAELRAKGRMKNDDVTLVRIDVLA